MLCQGDWGGRNTTIERRIWYNTSFQVKFPSDLGFVIGRIAIIPWLPTTTVRVAIQLILTRIP